MPIAESRTMGDLVYDKNNPFRAKITENRVLNKRGSAKDTRHIVVDITGSGIKYKCGDSLGVFPTNVEELVDAVIAALGAKGDEKVQIPRSEQEVSLRLALSSHLSLSEPTMKSLRAFLEKVTDLEEKKKLEFLLAPGEKETAQEFLSNREFIDLLEEFPSATFSPQEFVELLRKLRPRLYSIASSPTVFPEEVHLTVAVVRYETNERKRFGVCSTYLADRAHLNEPEVFVFVANSHFGLPGDDTTDMIMVGPGTGVAPFRSFIQERKARKAAGRMWLHFGDQHEATDYLYGEEFESYVEEGTLHRIDNAWSRDQVEKVYVQDKLLESANEVWSWLEKGAHFYVCGDAKRMAKDVDAALHKIIEEQGKKTEEEAKAFVKELKKTKRYQRDVY